MRNPTSLDIFTFNTKIRGRFFGKLTAIGRRECRESSIEKRTIRLKMQQKPRNALLPTLTNRLKRIKFILDTKDSNGLFLPCNFLPLRRPVARLGRVDHPSTES